MRIQFHGAAKTTTGSAHLLEVNGSRILLDCGLFQGKRKETFQLNRNPEFDAVSVDACVLSHAHIDHSGNLPSLIRRGFEGPIYATPATRDLCEIMLMDSAHLQARDVEYVNKRRLRAGKNPFEPLYEQADVKQTLKHFRTLRYEKRQEIAPGVIVSFHDAGHLLGSAFTMVQITEGSRTKRLLYTGDVGREGMPILKDPVVLHDVDMLLTESTYGNRLHPVRQDVEQRLENLCRKVLDRPCRLVIPSFSVGRTQQLLYFLHELWRQGRLRGLPVYVDSPLSVKATHIYNDHPECYDHEMLDILRRRDEPFSFGHVQYLTNVEDSKKLNNLSGPVIIISASGMCEGGRILHHLKNSVEDPKNLVLFVGYQAENTLGRRIVNGESPIKIFGERYQLKAEVHSIQALSAHADKNELLGYFRKMGPRVERAFVVHGEDDQSQPFAKALQELGAQNVTIPERGERVET